MRGVGIAQHDMRPRHLFQCPFTVRQANISSIWLLLSMSHEIWSAIRSTKPGVSEMFHLCLCSLLWSGDLSDSLCQSSPRYFEIFLVWSSNSMCFHGANDIQCAVSRHTTCCSAVVVGDVSSLELMRSCIRHNTNQKQGEKRKDIMTVNGAKKTKGMGNLSSTKSSR